MPWGGAWRRLQRSRWGWKFSNAASMQRDSKVVYDEDDGWAFPETGREISII